MAYRGDTLYIPFDRGGFSHNPNIDQIEPTAMVDPSRNINLDENGRRKRGGTAYITDEDYDAAISGTPSIMGMYDFRLRSGTRYLVVAADDGKIYRAHDATILASGWSTTNYTCFETFADELYMCDGENTPEKWDGTGNTSTLTAIPSDWAGTNQPQWVVRHGRGASERLWYGGVTGQQHKIYASDLFDGDNISDGDTTVIYIDTGDGFGIINAVEFGDRLIAFGKRQAYIIDDTSFATGQWGYTQAQWTGGLANFRLSVRLPNDIVCMMEDGEIYSVVAAQTYGDYKAASITRPSHMNRWIQDNVKLSEIDRFHSIYDPILRAIKFFVVRTGQSEIDTALVYFVDRKPEDAWSIHSNRTSVSGYSSASSCLYRVSTGEYKIYTGGKSTGRIWKLEESAKNDNSQDYYAGFKTPWISFQDPRAKKHLHSASLICQPKGDWNVTVDWWVDSVSQTAKTVSLAGIGGTLPFTLGTDILHGDELIDSPFDLRQYGKRVQFEIYSSTKDQDFYLSQLMIDYKTTGKEAD